MEFEDRAVRFFRSPGLGQNLQAIALDAVKVCALSHRNDDEAAVFLKHVGDRAFIVRGSDEDEAALAAVACFSCFRLNRQRCG